MTNAEIKRMLNGEDFWMTSNDVRARLLTYVKHLEKKQKAFEAEAKRAEKEAANPQPRPRKKRVAKKKAATE